MISKIRTKYVLSIRAFTEEKPFRKRLASFVIPILKCLLCYGIVVLADWTGLFPVAVKGTRSCQDFKNRISEFAVTDTIQNDFTHTAFIEFLIVIAFTCERLSNGVEFFFVPLGLFNFSDVFNFALVC